MGDDPTTLEEALAQIQSWRDSYKAKLVEISELNAEITRLQASVPDAAALRAAARFIDHLSHQARPCEVSEGDRDDADYEGGYDYIIHEARTIASLLRSEPRGETK